MPSCDLTANNTSLYMFCIISKRDLLYYFGKVCKKSVSLLIVSKVFLKSIKHAYTFFDDLKALSMIVLRVKM